MNALVARGLAIACCAAPLMAQSTTDTTHATRQALGDAWWTGPMLAASAGTLPPGHLLFEPYFYDVVSPHTNGFGSRAYIVYGLLNRFAVGLIPIIGYNKMSVGPSSSGVGLGDITIQGQYRLTQFQPGSAVPTMSVLVQQTFPTGGYDHLTRLSDGFGAGAYTTALALYSQTYFWMPSGRILRMRLDLTQQVYSTRVHVADVSVYGTGIGFSGTAIPGLSSSADWAAEYSLTQSWVLALDAVYGWNADTRVGGAAAQLHSGSSYQVGFAPAVEYNLNSSLGFLLGTRILEIGHNATPSVSPAIAINFVH
jgi:hypothetical protein